MWSKRIGWYLDYKKTMMKTKSSSCQTAVTWCWWHDGVAAPSVPIVLKAWRGRRNRLQPSKIAWKKTFPELALSVIRVEATKVWPAGFCTDHGGPTLFYTKCILCLTCTNWQESAASGAKKKELLPVVIVSSNKDPKAVRKCKWMQD